MPTKGPTKKNVVRTLYPKYRFSHPKYRSPISFLKNGTTLIAKQLVINITSPSAHSDFLQISVCPNTCLASRISLMETPSLGVWPYLTFAIYFSSW